MARPILSPNQEQAIQLLKKDGVPENAARVVVKALPKHMSAGKIRNAAIALIAAAGRRNKR
jgi:transcription initiation factor TFIIIB Brf1 subunit/transcription initiation factor TFIIB